MMVVIMMMMMWWMVFVAIGNIRYNPRTSVAYQRIVVATERPRLPATRSCSAFFYVRLRPVLHGHPYHNGQGPYPCEINSSQRAIKILTLNISHVDNEDDSVALGSGGLYGRFLVSDASANMQNACSPVSSHGRVSLVVPFEAAQKCRKCKSECDKGRLRPNNHD